MTQVENVAPGRGRGRGQLTHLCEDRLAGRAQRAGIFEMVREMAEAAAPARGHILNLGHGCLPDTPVEGVRAFTDAARALGA